MWKELRARRAARDGAADQRNALLESMRQTQGALSRAYDGFNRTGDPDLIESYVYEINALQSRYAYLLRQVRDLDSGARAAL